MSTRPAQKGGSDPPIPGGLRRIIQASVTVQSNDVETRRPRDYCTAWYAHRKMPDGRVTGILVALRVGAIHDAAGNAVQ